METEADMDIELEPRGKGMFQGRVVTAESYCVSVHGMLHVVSADLLEFSGDKQPPFAEEEAQRKLESAGMELGLALANMGAARHIALRGGAAALESVDDLAEDPDVRRALESLEKAEALAIGAHDGVEAARGHLGAAVLLLVLKDEDARYAAPWEQGPSLSERLNAVMELSGALSKAVDLVDATAAATRAAFGSGGSTDD